MAIRVLCFKRLLTAVLCLAGMLCGEDAFPQEAPERWKDLEGLWHGSWGGGEADGVVYQPVLAELVIDGNNIELHAFPKAGSLSGALRVDGTAKRMEVTPAAEDGRSTAPIAFQYELSGDRLTLTGADNRAVTLQRVEVSHNPAAGAPLEVVEATGIDESGNLLLTEFAVLQVKRSSAVYFQPRPRTVNTGRAAIYLVEENGLQELTAGEARDHLREPAPVVIAYRSDGDRPTHQFHSLWKDLGTVRPESEEVLKTVSRVLRAGTLVFIFPRREVPPP